jgi:peroxiredoxin
MPKRIIVFAVFLFSFVISLFAQPRLVAKLSESSIVKDSSGTQYSYDTWKNLLTSGYYRIKPVNPEQTNSEFLLIRLSEEQRQKMIDNMPKPMESSFFKTGSTIVNFKTTDINGNKINLKDLKGKIVVMNFWFIDCQPCRQEIPELNQLVNDYKDSTNIVFITVATDSKGALKDFLKKTPFNYTIIDGGRFITDQYEVKSFPTHLVLDKEGKVYYHSTGYGLGTPPWIRKSIKELLQSK